MQRCTPIVLLLVFGANRGDISGGLNFVRIELLIFPLKIAQCGALLQLMMPVTARYNHRSV